MGCDLGEAGLDGIDDCVTTLYIGRLAQHAGRIFHRHCPHSIRNHGRPMLRECDNIVIVHLIPGIDLYSQC